MVSPITNRIINNNKLSMQVYDNKSKKFIDMFFDDNDMKTIYTYNEKFYKLLNNTRDNSKKCHNNLCNTSIIETFVLSLPVFIKEKISFIGKRGNSIYYAFLSDIKSKNNDSVIKEIKSNVPYWIGPQNGVQIVVTPVGTLNKLNIGMSIDHRIMLGYDTKLLARDINKIYNSLLQ